MQRISSILFVFVVVCLVVVSPQSVSGHSLESDEVVGAILHINPEDDPIVGEEAVLFFEFKSKSGDFEPADCDCTILIELNEENVYSGPLFERQHLTNDYGFANAVILYIFNSPGDYLVTVNGSPKNAGQYDDFEFTYDVPVYRTSAGSRSAPSVAILGGIIAVIALGAIYFARTSKQAMSPSSKKKSTKQATTKKK